MKTAAKLRNEQAPLRRRRFGRRELFILLASWAAASLIIVSVDFARRLVSRERVFRYEEGDYIEEDFIVEDDFSFIDSNATEKLVSLNRSLANPVFIVRGEVTESVLDRFDRFVSFYGAALDDRDSEIAVTNLRNEFPGAAGLIDRESPRNTEKVNVLLTRTKETLEDIQYAGIFRIDAEGRAGASGIVEVVYAEESPDRRVTLIRDSLVRPENLAERIRSLDSLQDMSEEDREFIVALGAYFGEPNAYISEALTEENRERAEAATPPVTISVDAGTKLLNAGSIVTARQASILEALKERRDIGFRNIFDPFLFMAIIFALGIFSALNFDITLTNPKTMWLYITLMGVYVLAASGLVAFVRYPENLNVGLILPTALSTLLLAQLLQDRRMAILSSILMALLILFLTGGRIHEFLVTLASGIGGTLAVRQRETRMGLLRAGPRLAGIMSLVTFLTGILTNVPLRSSLIMTSVAAGNGFLTGVLSLAFLPLLEHLLNTATTFRLIELSDQNVPILKRMRLQAPGTYIHSQNVAHLAEAACDAIGADGLLARVGAYYHDIGKVDQAHFFVENQAGENKHDDMKATLSVAVIKSHVKIGIEKGRDLRLPDEVLAVIEQHHGTSVIRYFYDRALKEKGTDAASPDDYSYGGPKPRSREAAIVMLADSAEAATRTLKKPTAAKLEKYVWDLIMDRFKAGELNESYLTLRDLETVKATFVQVLTGHFHTRIEYPKTPEESA